MGRLIDEDMLMERLGFLNTPQEREENAGQIITLEDFDSIPTAYDVDKVVEELKVTGIVRRFDDLGRIAIPKELRKQLFGTPEKSEGMPMEIFMDKDTIVMRRYEENKVDDVCEWREEGLFLYTSCGDRVNAYSDDFKYCPYCSKQIKVVDNDK